AALVRRRHRAVVLLRLRDDRAGIPRRRRGASRKGDEGGFADRRGGGPTQRRRTIPRMTRPFSYEGKRVIVTGAASGMGAATVAMLAELGAEIHALDVRPVEGPVTRAYDCDCGDPDAIDLTVGLIGGPVHALFNVAGVPQTQAPLRVLGVNFLGLRHV